MLIYKNIPNTLTIIRIIIIPVIIFSFYCNSTFFHRQVSGLLFLIAIITDFLDGYVARRYNSESNLGRILDPIADKILISSVLIMLVKFNIADELAVLLILAREFLISGIREFMAQYNFRLPVSKMAKIKTVIQMIAVFMLLIGKENSNHFGNILLWIAACFTVLSSINYIKLTLTYLKETKQIL